MGESSSSSSTLERAQAALTAEEWERAQGLFEEVLDDGPNAAALQGIAIASYWRGDEETSLDAWSQAFAQYERQGDTEDAAYAAIILAADYRIGGNLSVSNGWLGRTQRLLADCGDCPGRGWLEIELSKRAEDPSDAAEHSATAAAIAREIGAPDLEASALSHLGMARIDEGDAEGGLALLDEALALATGVRAADPFAIADACCTTLIACERIADPERARDWGQVISEYIRRRNYMPLASWCRAVYAGFLIATGHWEDAERELLGALEDAERHPGSNRVTALANLAELRLLQGRIEEAEQLLEGIADRPGALGTIVRLHLARGEVDLAAARVERQLEAEPTGADRASLHGLQAQIEIARQDPAAAREAIAAMREHGELAQRDDLVALSTVFAAQAVALAGESARPGPLEAAIERFDELAMPLDEGIARLELARAIQSTQQELAVEQARAALRIFERLGAAPYADRAAKLLRDLGAPGRASPRGGDLSKREAEVLSLLGAGLSNAEIAERLVISPRTAEHHVASVLRKLELRNRSEAAAYAVRAGL
jgi:DNA-binding NarL/FixJ family response regulator/tetratricopeptide (TPR) repeat protein